MPSNWHPGARCPNLNRLPAAIFNQSLMLQHRPIRERLALLLAVGGVHAVVILTLCNTFGGSLPRQSANDLFVTAFIQPKIRDDGAPTAYPDLSALIMRARTPLIHIEQPEISFEVSRNNAASSAAPTLQDSGQRDTEPFIKQAALLPGEGVTVVLRIEVLESGEPGRIEIDTSSGSAQVDEAAIAYAHTRHWYAGRTNGTPHPMWIRWGVRLQA
jgi:TonB family protein